MSTPRSSSHILLYAFTTLAAAAFLGGCMTVPVTSKKLDTMFPLDAGNNATTSAYYGDLPQVIVAVEDLRRLYFDEVTKQATVREGIGDALIPLTAWALYRGVTDSSAGVTRLLAKAGIGGAALYGWGNYTLSPDRQMIYLAGNDALGCAVTAMRPYLFTVEEFGNSKSSGSGTFLGDRQQLSTAVEEATVALRNYDVEAGSKGWPQLPTRRPDLDRARTDLDSAREVVAKANKFKAEVDTSGLRLRQAALNIRNQVTVELVKAQPDLASITSITSGLLETAPQFVGGRTFKMLQTEPTPSAQSTRTEQDENTAWNKIANAMATVAVASKTLSLRLNDVAELAKSVAALDTCKFQGPASDFRISPDVQEIELAPNQSASFSVYGGMGVPRVSRTGVFAQDVDKVLTLTKTVSDGTYVATIAVQSTPGTGNNVQLDFTDGSGRAKRKVDVKIRLQEPEQKPAPAKGATKPGPETTCKVANSKGIDFTMEKQIKNALTAMGVTGANSYKSDGSFTSKACAAMQKCAKEKKLSIKDEDWPKLGQQDLAALINAGCIASPAKPSQ